MALRETGDHRLQKPLGGIELGEALEIFEQASQRVELRTRAGIGRQEAIELPGLGRGCLAVEDREHQLELLGAMHL